MRRRELLKRIDVRCGCGDSGGVVRNRGKLGRWHEGLRGGGHRWRPAGAGVRVQNSRGRRLAAVERPRRSRSKTAKLPRRPRHAGGRPLAFIPRSVLEHAQRLFEKHRRWVDVLRELEAYGDGRYARNTLIRRIRRPRLEAPGQNSRSSDVDVELLEQLQEPSKTRPVGAILRGTNARLRAWGYQ